MRFPIKNLKKTNNNTVTVIKAESVNTAPWFDILLFETRCRLRLPKPSIKPLKDLGGNLVDKRPFVNTLAKTRYYKGEDADETGQYIVSIYRASWGFYDWRWFAKPKASLNFDFNAIAVCKPDMKDYPDVREPEIGCAWIRYSYRKSQAIKALLNLSMVEGGHMQVNIREKPDAQAIADTLNYDTQVLRINGHIAYRTQLTADTYDIFLPFTAQDMLQLSFALKGHGLKPLDNKAAYLEQGNQLSQDIIHTLEIIYPDKKISQK